jgi:hypothetical protein
MDREVFGYLSRYTISQMRMLYVFEERLDPCALITVNPAPRALPTSANIRVV